MASGGQFVIGDFGFDASAGELRSRGGARRLEPRAAAVLAALCRRRAEMVSRQELLDEIWGDGEGSDEALTQAVSQIRRALQELGASPRAIETLAKRGYRLVGDSDRVGDPGPPDRGAPGWRRGLIAACVAILALTALLLAAPHGLRHSVRHALGLGPSAH